jgi:hypothetical protein
MRGRPVARLKTCEPCVQVYSPERKCIRRSSILELYVAERGAYTLHLYDYPREGSALAYCLQKVICCFHEQMQYRKVTSLFQVRRFLLQMGRSRP